MTTAVVRALGDLAHRAAHEHPGDPCACPPPAVLADREDGTVVRSGAVVAKAHAAGTDTSGLLTRLTLANDPRLTGILLAPLIPGPCTPSATLHGRPVTLWPHGRPVDPGDPDAAPWEDAAVLLAGLHRTPAPPLALPPMRGPAKAALAVARMRAARPGDPATASVLEAWHRLRPGPATRPPRPRTARATSATVICTSDSSSATRPRTAPGCSSTSTTRVSAIPPGTSPAPPPGTRPGSCPRGLAPVPGRLPGGGRPRRPCRGRSLAGPGCPGPRPDRTGRRAGIGQVRDGRPDSG